MRPRFDFALEWEPETDGVEIGTFASTIRVPTYPVWGPPPPFLSGGYTFTRLDAPDVMDLAKDLHEFSLGASWLRPINDRWTLRFMLGAAFSSDLDNTTSDAWRFRGGAFAIYRPNSKWSFTVGALATGRNDIPVLPAIGAIWEPRREIRVDLMLPRPKVMLLLAESPNRQHWGYVGGGLHGGSWAYLRESGAQERVDYREWRLVLGWESGAPRAPGAFQPTGVVFNAEVGYVFGREFEFDSGAPEISIGDTLLLRTQLRF